MKVIGLTGGVGCGKSTLAKILEEEWGACVIITDELGHLAMEQGSKTFREIITLFGEGILDEKGLIDRKRLGDMVFSEPDKLAALNGLIHPFVRERTEELLRKAEKEGRSLAVLESAILLESGYRELCDEIWVVTADYKARLERLKASRGYSEEKLTSIMARQMGKEELERQADVQILNNGGKEELKERLREIFTGRI